MRFFTAVLLVCLLTVAIDVPCRATEPAFISEASLREATNYLGQWMWDSTTRDKQICRFWKRFDIPKGAHVDRAQLRMAADNAYTLFLDGRELGRGGDWRTVTVYDLAYLLPPGPHVLAVEGFNDNDKAGVIMGMHVSFADGQSVNVASDKSWRIAPLDDSRWHTRRNAPDKW
ncbi:MAG TPA: hypothetical protein VGN61_06750, partial [Verrucomicrobiae bacterium]